MRIRSQLLQYIKRQSRSYSQSEKLGAISAILEELSNYGELLSKVLEDLKTNPNSKTKSGRKGMTAEQVIRAYIFKMYKQSCSYRNLSEYTKDSASCREFLKLPPFCSKGFHYKTLQSNIKLISEETLDFFHSLLKTLGVNLKLEDGAKLRSDATSIESNIHYPTDWSLMHDCNLVLSRCMSRLYEEFGVELVFTNHYKASKTKLFKINNSRSYKQKRLLNMELIRLTKKTTGYAEGAVKVLENYLPINLTPSELNLYSAYLKQLKRTLPQAKQVVDVAHRRIVKREKIPTEEKIVSIFEPHTDIISKGTRDVVFGHKSTITTGKSGLILDVITHDGNPADSTIVSEIIERHQEFYSSAPTSMVFDGCYSSQDNRELLTQRGVKRVCFSKEKKPQDPRERKEQKILRYFRAGIEATISELKRMFGWTRIMDKGKQSFHKSVKASAIAFNLVVFARIKLQQKA